MRNRITDVSFRFCLLENIKFSFLHQACIHLASFANLILPEFTK